MLQAAIALHDMRVSEIMTPRVDLRAIPITASRMAILDMFRDTRRRTLPVYGNDPDDMRGMLYARDFLSRPRDGIESLVRPITFIPEQADLMQLIRLLQENGMRRAVVVDEYGGTAGIVTMSDVVAQIVGGFPDPGAPLPAPMTEQIDRDSYRVSGDLSVRQWADRLGVREIDRRVNTMGGLVAAKLGRLPRVGDTVHVRNLVLTVERMDRHRIEHVLLHRVQPGDDVAEGAP